MALPFGDPPLVSTRLSPIMNKIMPSTASYGKTISASRSFLSISARGYESLLDSCVLPRGEEWSHGCPRLLFGKDFSEDCRGRLPTLQQLMSVQDQFLDQRLALLSTHLPNGFDRVCEGFPFSR